MVKVVLEGLEFHGYHGVFTEEASLGARFVVDVEMVFAPPAQDALEETVDYGAVYALVRELVVETRYRLIETLAGRIAERLVEAFARLQNVRVRVHKPHAPLPGVVRDVYVEVGRQR